MASCRAIQRMRYAPCQVGTCMACAGPMPNMLDAALSISTVLMPGGRGLRSSFSLNSTTRSRRDSRTCT